MTGVPPRGPAVPVAVSDARERVVELLSQRFAQDGLTVEELDRRLALAYQAESLAELTALVADLPGGTQVAQYQTPAIPTAYVPAERESRVLAVFSSTRRTGFWPLPPRLQVVSAFAELLLDLRDVQLSGPWSVVEVKAAFCALRILVPPGVRVVNRLQAVLAEVTDRAEYAASEGAPVIVIEGWAAFAEVKIRNS